MQLAYGTQHNTLTQSQTVAGLWEVIRAVALQTQVLPPQQINDVSSILRLLALISCIFGFIPDINLAILRYCV